MFLYTEKERRNAAQYLYNYAYNLAHGKNTFGWLLDAPDDVASQLTNCFASDLCSPGSFWGFSETGADSDAWEDPGTGITVSPDDILKWDPATEGGPYGEAERLLYRPAEYVRVTQWEVSEGAGSLSGRVFFSDGTPAVGATVGISGFDVTADDQGRYNVGPHESGRYDLQARAVFDGEYLNKDETVEILQDTPTTFDIVLPEGLQTTLVTIAGALKIKDGEMSYDIIEYEFVRQAITLFRDGTTSTSSKSNCVGKEAYAKLFYKTEWLKSSEVTGRTYVPGLAKITVKMKIYEEDSCGTTEGEDSDSTFVILAPGESGQISLATENEDATHKPDQATAALTIINSPNFEADEPTRDVHVKGNMHILDHDWGPNETGDKAFDEPLKLDANQRALAMGQVRKRVDREVTGRFDVMAILLPNNKDVRIYSIEHQEDGDMCRAQKHWTYDILDGTSPQFVDRVSKCSNYVKTTYTVTNPAP
jgi:hypothetical protein